VPLSYEAVARRIDHALLGPSMTEEELREGCRLAAEHGVASVCIKPFAVGMAAEILRGTSVAVGTTVGFPHGGHHLAVKVFEAGRALDDGATELDMVINSGHALGGEWAAVRSEIAAVTEVAHRRGAVVKVILETCYLDADQKARLCTLCGEVGADYVKTSTGFGPGGAVAEDLILMRRAAPPQVKLKASGGIRTLDAAIAFIDLGCDRIGTSKTAEILDELKARLRAGRST
jgi:deoxyribose-phosphate aldolase